MVVEVGEDVIVEGVVIVVGVAVEEVDVDDAGGVRPPQVQAPLVPRGIYKETNISHRSSHVITFFNHPSSITRLLVEQRPSKARIATREMQGCKGKKNKYLILTLGP